MRTILLLVKWAWREWWPLIVILFLIGAHLLLIFYFGLNANTTNKTISLLSQIFGGILILYSIDSNIGVIKEKSLFSIFIQALKDCPLIKRSNRIEMQVGAAVADGVNAKITIGRNPQNIEEKIEYLQEQINEVKHEIEQESKELNKRINDFSKKINAEIQETNTAIRKIESKVDEVSVGGIKIQIFGVLLMIWGAVSGYLVTDNAISTYSYVGCSLHNFISFTSHLIKLHCT